MSRQPLARPQARPLLWPLTPLYRLALGWRELRLHQGWEQVRRLQRPVVSIGNISAGGAGKTPLTIALVQALAQRGVTVDVLSRGYGRLSSAPAQVNPAGNYMEFGDEPLLIARAAQVPVYVARQRFEAGQMAEAGFEKGGLQPSLLGKEESTQTLHTVEELSREAMECQGTTSVVPQTAQNERGALEQKPSCYPPGQYSQGSFSLRKRPLELIHQGYVDSAFALAPAALSLHLLDDGFQHRQLHRDVDIVLVNARDLDDSLLPAGNLREPVSALKRATILAIPANEPGTEARLRALGLRQPVWRVERRMQVPALVGPVVAFCGIARPQQFFTGLTQVGLDLVVQKVYADHHRYTAAELTQLVRVAQAADATLVTTDKDRVRLEAHAHLVPPGVQLRTAGLVSQIVDEDLNLDWLLDLLGHGSTMVEPCPKNSLHL